MPYVALIGLYFAPILCLLGAGWSYVRWKNEHENEALSGALTRTASAFSSPRLSSLLCFWH